MDFIKNGFNSFQLKVIALILMTFDHIASFLWGAFDIPIWFNWLGRLSAPIFIFIVAEGFYHTSNRKKYMLRLYLWSVGMALGNSLMNSVFPNPNGSIIINNIFATMFLITVCLYGIERIKEKKIVSGIALIGLPFVLSGLLFLFMNMGMLSIFKFMMLFVPTALTVEGGFVWLALGIGCYLLRGKKVGLSIFYILLSAFNFWVVAGAGLTYENLFLLNFQWLMVFALPFMLAYNGEKGRSMKYFFYLYYPLHCYGLYLLGLALAR
ncbi:MAG: TraX family protein [Cellulosilyticaceae bacterium]